MSYTIKPMSFDPQKILGMSEKLPISHDENNNGGAFKTAIRWGNVAMLHTRCSASS